MPLGNQAHPLDPLSAEEIGPLATVLTEKKGWPGIRFAMVQLAGAGESRGACVQLGRCF